MVEEMPSNYYAIIFDFNLFILKEIRLIYSWAKSSFKCCDPLID